MSELEVLMLMLTLFSPLFFGIGFFVGYKSGKANEQRQSIYDAKEQAKETRIAIEEVRTDERTKAIDEYNAKIKECCSVVGYCDFEDLDRIAIELKE